MPLNIFEKKINNCTLYASGDLIKIIGQINEINPNEFLDPFFQDVKENMSNKLIIDITELTYINSSGIKPIVTFILTRNQDTNITFKINQQLGWQRKSIEVIQSLDPDHTEIIEIDK